MKFLVLLVSFLLACSPQQKATDDENFDFSENFDSLSSSVWLTADGYSNNGVFNCDFSATHARVQVSVLQLTLDNTAGPSKSNTCAEVHSLQTFQYGTFTVRMKVPPQNNGMVSSFFLYTASPHDEIDLEFLGKNTTQLQLNYFTAGVGNHEQIINLGFDASAAYHTYSIQWRESSLQWYVDGQLVQTATGSLPSQPMKIFMNIWNGTTVDSWLNPFIYSAPLTVEYDQVTHSP